ncbi:hypothetical protein ACFQS7_30620 [Dankookia sp. GCM10030260]
MPVKPNLGGLALVAILVAGCEPAKQTTPIALTPGTVEYDMRQQQLRNVQSDTSRGMQNPAVTGVNPSVSGIERAETGGSGGAGSNLGGIRTDGTIQRQGSGAPSTQSMVPTNPRRPAPF